jgi:antitoxin (DNA-binding transcriptional repressor) of toxin-antitoxin stability system
LAIFAATATAAHGRMICLHVKAVERNKLRCSTVLKFDRHVPMTAITLEEAQQDLPILIRRVLAGEDIVIGAYGSEVKMTAVAPAHSHIGSEPAHESYRGRGVLKGQLVVGPEFFEPLSDEECGVGGNPDLA